MALKDKRAVRSRDKIKLTLDDDEVRFATRQPDMSGIHRFEAELPDDQKPYAELYWHMECPHSREEIVSTQIEDMHTSNIHLIRCKECGLVRHFGTRTQMLVSEWRSYCPDGFDMFEWEDLFTKDKSLWRFVHDEVLAGMVETYREEA